MNVGSTGCLDQRQQQQQPSLRVRREPFEYGLLPLPSLIFADPLTSLGGLRTKLCSDENGILSLSPDGEPRLDCAGIALALDLSEDAAQLLLEILLSVLPDSVHGNPSTAGARPPSDGSAAVSLEDLLLFLYIQNYKKPPIRPHKDAAAVADVWPSTSAFDGFLASLSPLQVKTGKKSFPSQADEEAHRLTYVQKHLPALLSLLAHAPTEDDSSQVLSLEQFNRLGFLLQVVEKGTELVPLSQSAPFFANSDPDMPAAPVPLPQVLEWLLEHLSAPSDRTQERWKENGPDGEADVTMLDACANTAFAPLSPRGTPASCLVRTKSQSLEGLIFIDGITKVSVLKNENEINGESVKVSNCHDSVVYILAPMKFASVYGCSDSIIVLGAVEQVVKIEHCERVQLIVCSRRICITNCRECLFNLAVNQRPLILGENHNLQVAPYNTFYPQLEAHLTQACIELSVNKWDKFLTLGVIDPHDSLPHAAGVVDAPAEGASLLSPDRFTNFVIPKWNDSQSSQESFTQANPFTLPKAYLVAQQQRNKAVDSLRNALKNVPMDEGRKQDLSQAINVHFREWLYASGNIRQLYEFQESEKD